MPTPLCDLADRYGTNKAYMGYTPHYYQALRGWAPLGPHRILEVGIGAPGLSGGPSEHGASLRMWSEFFPSALVVGLDVRPDLLFEDGNITTRWADVHNHESLVDAVRDLAPFDLVVDDAVHDLDVQYGVFWTLRPFLRPGGIYAIEDVCPWKAPDGDLGHMVQELKVFSASDEVTVHDGSGAEKVIVVRT